VPKIRGSARMWRRQSRIINLRPGGDAALSPEPRLASLLDPHEDGTLGRATGIRYGINRLELRVRDGRGAVDYEVVDFALVRRSPRLLRLGGPRRSSRRAQVRLRLPRKRVAVAVRLNGRRVFMPAAAPGRRLRIVRLSGDEGLRHGRNLLRITAVDRVCGRYAVKRRRIVITRTAPIPGAGRYGRVRTKRRLRLDARDTRAAHLPPSLRYRWRIVRKPRGSRARLRAATTRRPRLRPDVPGRYRLKMTVTERIPGRAARRPTLAGAAQASALVTSASDTTTVSATPDGEGLGVAVDTRNGKQVTVGGQNYATPDTSKSLQLVVLDRTTLEPITNQSFAGDDAGTQSLANAVSQLGNNCPDNEQSPGCRIAIITTRDLGNRRPPLTDNQALANLNSAVAAIGGRPISAGAALTATSCSEPNPVCGGFSAIGSPGFEPGDGAVNPGLGADVDGNGGALNGYFQLDQHGKLLTFVPGDHIPFDTAAAGDPTTSTQATIKVGDATYTSTQLVSGMTAGAYVLVLDAGTLAFREDGTFGLRGGSVDDTIADLQKMHALLTKYQNDQSALVFVQSIGQLVRRDEANVSGGLPFWWNEVAGDLQALGGHRTLFNALDGIYQSRGLYDGTYAQVAPGGGSGARSSVTASQVASRTPGQLSGTLARNDSYQFYVDSAAATATSAMS
jgi:hypothetical protein